MRRSNQQTTNNKSSKVLTRESRTSITRSETLRRSRMARVAAAMWPGNQFMMPPPLMKPISPTDDAFFTILFTVPISIFSNSACVLCVEGIEKLKPFLQWGVCCLNLVLFFVPLLLCYLKQLHLSTKKYNYYLNQKNWLSWPLGMVNFVFLIKLSYMKKKSLV